MKFLICILLLILSTLAYSQNTDTIKCIKVVDELSYFWQVDSSGNNGFRLYTYNRFLKCKLEHIYADYLLIKLGKPNVIRRTNKGVEYHYFCFDHRAMPKSYNAPPICLYIAFKFENDAGFLSCIETGEIEF